MGLFIGCSTGPEEPDEYHTWMQDFLDVDRMEPEQAEQQLEALAQRAPSSKQARDAQFERARLARRRGDAETARRRFQALWDQQNDDAVASRSKYELGRMAAEVDGDEHKARALMKVAITETAPWAGTEFALSFLIRQERKAGRVDALVDDLAEWAAMIDDDRLAAQLYLERGLLLDGDLGRPNQALQSYREAYGRCQKCAATDEALFQMGQLYSHHQHWEAAVASYQIVARRTGRSFFVGTYHSQRAGDARYELGLVEMLHRRDYDAASRHFQRYLKVFPNHTYTDDAAWHLAQIERLDGTPRSYRRALEAFIEDYPHSRLIDHARQQLADLS